MIYFTQNKNSNYSDFCAVKRTLINFVSTFIRRVFLDGHFYCFIIISYNNIRNDVSVVLAFFIYSVITVIEKIILDRDPSYLEMRSFLFLKRLI